jgi:Tfp pilus assembly protein PilE
MKLKRRQTGLTFVGLIVVGTLLAIVGIIGAQVFPTYLEYMAVEKAAKKAAAGSTVAEVRQIFDKAAAIDDIRTISGKDLTVGKQGDRVVVSFDYEREIHLAGPGWLVMKYKGSSQ